MKNFRILLCLIVLNGVAPAAYSAEAPDSGGVWNLLPEAVLRPFGFMALLGGGAMFVACSPVTAIASIEEPHEALQNSLNGFVLAPVRYTFNRPLGDYSFKVFLD